ncbi:DNA-binding domain-containing protein [Chelativorans salis]|uniref:DNA-binding domain-containing protein n=1 Tax=Chelativorans salis TaxID=2978478 RepID=A0ABT2LT31_9HYPH|nr:DNA-binding domain-containing protein [Chelativorans sp. EGI FJ00035]MCT7377506.1 putative DNA-binding domain-containing protein [Chelativorans sp. EGI FJ00035]
MPERVISLAKRGRGRLAYAGAFTPPLLDPEVEEPGLIAGPNGKAAKKRYNVYRNNVTVSLVKALADTFPATRRIVGEDFFRAMARIHVRQTPPTSPLLFEYGRGFADFIENFEHARTLPYLADVARIERAWLDAYHAADTGPLKPDALAAIPPEKLSQATFTAHPAARVVRSRFPAVTIFALNRQDGPVGRLETADPEDGLVTRPELEVIVRRLPPGGAAFLEGLMAGKPLGEAVVAALEDDERFVPAANIAGMLEAGAFTAVAVSEG